GSGIGTGNGGGNDVKSAAPGTLSIPAGGSGTVSLGEDISVSVPAGASDRELRIAIRKIEDTAAPVNGQSKLLSAVFELENGSDSNLQKPAAVTVKFDASQLGRNQRAAIFRYDEAKKAWLELESVITENKATVSLEQFGRLAVFAIDEAPSASAMPLTDMKGHWAEQRIRQAVSSGIVDGYEDGTFKPEATVTRAEFTVLLARALQLPDGSSGLTFADREQIGSWAADAVAKAVEAGIITGYDDGSFRPDVAINRAEMAVMIARALGWKADAGVLTPFADDGTIPSWAKPFVMAAAQKNMLEGREGNRFAPLDTATRAEAVVLLLRILEVTAK
ncbi:MAG: 6-bladed beta-propeller, partial [Paenibacillus sp.]|nr:6-bladed beta-propeller [Paenibacillus sp.]